MKNLLLCQLVLLFALANVTLADDRPGHYEGKQSATLDAALENLSAANARMAELMADGSLEDPELAEIHQLTYTAENALEKLSEELAGAQQVLEMIHKASERFEGDVVAEQTPLYLEVTRKLFGLE